MQPIDFGLPNGSRYLKIDARAGCFRVKDDGQEVSFTELTAAIDLFHVKVGHFAFTKTGILFVEGAKTPPPPPIDGLEYKLGVALRLISSDQPAGCTEALGEREVTNTSIVVRRALAELYQQAMAQADGRNNGEWPVIHCTGFKKVSGARGVAYAPIMQIIDWKTPTAADTNAQPEF